MRELIVDLRNELREARSNAEAYRQRLKDRVKPMRSAVRNIVQRRRFDQRLDEEHPVKLMRSAAGWIPSFAWPKPKSDVWPQKTGLAPLRFSRRCWKPSCSWPRTATAITPPTS